MCCEIGTLCVKVHVSINHVPVPPDINGRKQLTLKYGKMAILRVADTLKYCVYLTS